MKSYELGLSIVPMYMSLFLCWKVWFLTGLCDCERVKSIVSGMFKVSEWEGFLSCCWEVRDPCWPLFKFFCALMWLRNSNANCFWWAAYFSRFSSWSWLFWWRLLSSLILVTALSIALAVVSEAKNSQSASIFACSFCEASSSRFFFRLTPHNSVVVACKICSNELGFQ